MKKETNAINRFHASYKSNIDSYVVPQATNTNPGNEFSVHDAPYAKPFANILTFGLAFAFLTRLAIKKATNRIK